MHALELVVVTAQGPLVGAQLVVGQDLDRVHVVHGRDEAAQQMGGTIVVGIARHNHIAHARLLLAPGQVLGKGQRARVGNAHQHAMDVRIDLLEIQHHQVGVVQQRLQHFVVVQCIAIGVQTGMDAVLVTGHEPVPHELVLQQRFPPGGRHAASRGLQIMTVGHHLLHHLGHRHLMGLVALQVPGVTVVTVQAAHQAALQEQDITKPGAIDGTAGLDGMDEPGSVVAPVQVRMLRRVGSRFEIRLRHQGHHRRGRRPPGGGGRARRHVCRYRHAVLTSRP